MSFQSTFTSWWLARDARLRKIVKGALVLLALVFLFFFLSFSSNWSEKGDGARTISDATFTVGRPAPWYRWEKHEEREMNRGGGGGSIVTFRQESRFDYWSSSFGAGVACLLCLSLRRWLADCEKIVS